MKNNSEEISKEKIVLSGDKKISWKDAIKQTGYIALSVSTMMILHSKPNEADGRSRHETSYSPPPTDTPRSCRPIPKVHGNNLILIAPYILY